MGVSYWARWACNGPVGDLTDLVLPHVLAEGYDLLTSDPDRHTFDRGGVMKRISWSLSGGRWDQAPVDLTVTYSCSHARSVANFYWKLSIRPFPTTPKEQAGFEILLQGQMNRIIAGLNEQLAQVPVEEDQEAGQEGAALQVCWESGREPPQDPVPGRFAEHRHPGCYQAVAAASLVAERSKVCRCGVHAEGAPRCVLCHRSAVPVAGTSSRYYCLACRHHVPCVPTT